MNTDDIRKRDLSMTYFRIQVGLPVPKEEVDELVRRAEEIRRRDERLILIILGLAVLLVTYIFLH